MDAHAEGKIYKLASGKWYVHCRWCSREERFEADLTEDQAYGMLTNHKWRLSMPGKKYAQRNWSCPACAKWFTEGNEDEHEEETTATATTTDTAESASQEVQELKAESVALKAEIEMWKAEIVEVKSGLKAVIDQHVASEAERDDVIKNLKQIVETLAAQVTSVPDDEL